MSAVSLLKVSAAASVLMLLAACGGSDTASSSSVAAATDSTQPAVVAATTDNTATTVDNTASTPTPAPVGGDAVASVIAAASDMPVPPPAPSDQPVAPTPDTASSAAPAVADASGPSVQPAASGTPAQNWLKVCGPTPSGQKGCLMRQVVVTGDNPPHYLGSFLLSETPGQESPLVALAAVPLGVLLPFGMTWQIDSDKPIRVPFMTCDTQTCSSQLVINEAYLANLKKGTKLTLVAKNRKNEDLTITINLAGFKTVYDGQATVSQDDLSKSQSGQAALEKVLQNRAQAAAQALESSASGQ